MRVLVIMDLQSLSTRLCESLRATGHTVTAASSLKSATTALRNQEFDIVIIDPSFDEELGGDNRIESGLVLLAVLGDLIGGTPVRMVGDLWNIGADLRRKMSERSLQWYDVEDAADALAI